MLTSQFVLELLILIEPTQHKKMYTAPKKHVRLMGDHLTHQSLPEI